MVGERYASLVMYISAEGLRVHSGGCFDQSQLHQGRICWRAQQFWGAGKQHQLWLMAKPSCSSRFQFKLWVVPVFC